MAADAKKPIRLISADPTKLERRAPDAARAGAACCDACGAPMKPMGHCKYWCMRCGFLRTCNDVI
jgi:hypothetical protein